MPCLVRSFLGLRSIDDELDTGALTFEEEGALNLRGGFIPKIFALGTSLIVPVPPEDSVSLYE
jgi:hypothetical protein